MLKFSYIVDKRGSLNMKLYYQTGDPGSIGDLGSMSANTPQSPNDIHEINKLCHSSRYLQTFTSSLFHQHHHSHLCVCLKIFIQIITNLLDSMVTTEIYFWSSRVFFNFWKQIFFLIITI